VGFSFPGSKQGRKIDMLPHGIARPAQLTILTKALEDYCHEAQIDPATREYAYAGRLIWSLYEGGISSPEELEHALRANSVLIQLGAALQSVEG
jgi:hypothetical protein